MSAVVAGVLAGGAVLVWFSRPAALLGRRQNAALARARSARSPGGAVLVVGGLMVGVVVVLVGDSRSALVLAAVAVGAFFRTERKRAKVMAGEARMADAVADLVSALGADVAAGAAPLESLAEFASETASAPAATPRRTLGLSLAAAVAQARLGGDLWNELRRLAKQPGAEGLRDLAIAWEVAERSGARLTNVLDGVIEGLTEKRSARVAVDGALAGARASARLLAALPVFGLGMGAALGANPLAFLAGSPVGRACLFAGLGLEAAGVWWTERLAATARRAAS